MTKKAAALLLAASLAVSVCATPVFADDTPDMSSKDGVAGGTETKVIYKVTQEFKWTVPATINFGQDAGVNQHPKVTTNVDQDANKTKIGEAANSSNDWKGTAPKVMVTKNVIDTGKALKITLKPTGGDFKVKSSTTELTYSVKTVSQKKDSNDVTPYTGITVDKAGSNILELVAGENTGEVVLDFELSTATTEAEIAGTYEGTVTFTADATQGPTTPSVGG